MATGQAHPVAKATLLQQEVISTFGATPSVDSHTQVSFVLLNLHSNPLDVTKPLNHLLRPVKWCCWMKVGEETEPHPLLPLVDLNVADLGYDELLQANLSLVYIITHWTNKQTMQHSSHWTTNKQCSTQVTGQQTNNAALK